MHSNILKKTIFIIIIALSSVMGQETNSHQFGLTASFSGAQLDLLFPIRVDNRVTISPGIGVASLGNSYTELHLSISPKFYFTDNTVKPYLGVRGVYLNSAPDEGDSVTDYLVGILGGGEYFIDEQFSFGIEAQLNFSISDANSLRFGNPDEVNINTATLIFASIYF